MAEPLLCMWTIYDHPRDYPNEYVAREWVIDVAPRPTGKVITCKYINVLRLEFEERGLVRLPRDPSDDLLIVETWV